MKTGNDTRLSMCKDVAIVYFALLLGCNTDAASLRFQRTAVMYGVSPEIFFTVASNPYESNVRIVSGEDMRAA